MQRSIKFLEAVLPAEGLRVVGHKPRGWKSGFKHEFLQSNEGVIAHTQHLEDLDITSYYALATYESPDEGRTAANALWVKSLWLDMDFKQFDAPTDAVAQLTSFAGVVGQPSYVVMSGGGLHVYWVLEEALPVEQWRPLAQAWQATFQHHGVTADAVSADVARVLRLPYTYNRKAEYEQPRLVTIMQDTGARYTPDDLLPHLVEVEIEVDRHEIPRGIVLPAAAFDLPDNGDLENDVFQESHVQGIAKECKQIGQAFVNQAGTPEYVWHAVLQLLRHVVNGRAVAHLFSNKHPTYSERDTDAKLDNLEAKDIGPTTCARFHAINPEGCAGCPHNIVTPLTLGYPTPEPVETPLPPSIQTVVAVSSVGEVEKREVEVQRESHADKVIPEGSGYAMQAGWLVYRGKNKDGEVDIVPIFHGFFEPIRLETDPANNYETVVRVAVYPHGQKPRHLIIPNKALADRRAFSMELKSKGVNFMSQQADKILRLMEMMVGGLSAQGDMTPIVNQMGWQDDEQTFVIGDVGYSPKGVVAGLPTQNAIRNTLTHFEPKGTLAGWKRAAAIYNRAGGEAYQLALCYGAAGLVLPSTGYSGVVMALYSSASGRGKTTVGFGALSWWGDPDLLKSQAADTNNALFSKASRYRSLPMVIDEVTEKPLRDMGDVVYHMSLGREKERLQSNSDPRPTLPPWNLPVITTSNAALKPLLHHHRADAQGLFARVFEMELGGELSDSLTLEEKEYLRDGFTANCGHAGPMLALHYMNHRERYERERVEIERQMYIRLGGDPAFRFWVASVSAALIVARAAVDLGLVDYDLDALQRWALQEMTRQEDSSEQLIESPEDILSTFLSANVNNSITRYTRMVANGSPLISFIPEMGIRGRSVAIRVDVVTGKLYVSVTHLRVFCVDTKRDLDTFLKGCATCRDSYGEVLLPDRTIERYSLGAGTQNVTGAVPVFVFNLNHEFLQPSISLFLKAGGIDSRNHLKVVS